jgi:DNA-binding transcriptional MerR regulator
MQRAGNRRYYRPGDVELARKINRLLNQEGYTVRGVQKLLRQHAGEVGEASPVAPAVPADIEHSTEEISDEAVGVDVFRLIALRNRLAAAIDL